MTPTQRKALKLFLEQVEELSAKCGAIGTMADSLGPKVRAESVSTLKSASETLSQLADQLDPVEQPDEFFDPTSPSIAGKLISEHLASQQRIPIDELVARGAVPATQFYGSGVYAIYYEGDFAAYAPICGTNHPIYVGKADPMEPDAESPRAQGLALHKRLKEHRATLNKACNLNTGDFFIRFLVTGSGWQAAVEQVLIKRYSPVWNKETGVLSGFGKHGDSAATRANRRSSWDTLHPGRQWAAANPDHDRAAEEIIERIQQHFERHPPDP